ncbi:MAG: PepSY-associated TM helix domain-containing protein [Pseudomonadota bacterium]
MLRQIHHWGSLLVMLQMGIVISAGLLLMLKKEIDWIQPPTIKGTTPDTLPTKSIEELFQIARLIPELELNEWRDLSRVDVKPQKGIVKIVSANNWEVQIDLTTGETLQVAYRRSDIIEQLHDGSFFADWIKLYVFFPSGIVLLVLWGSGIYLFFLPYWKRFRKKRSSPR